MPPARNAPAVPPPPHPPGPAPRPRPGRPRRERAPPPGQNAAVAVPPLPIPPLPIPLGVTLTPARPDDAGALFALVEEAFAPWLSPLGAWDNAREARQFRRGFVPGQSLVLRDPEGAAGLWTLQEIPGGLYLMHAVLAPRLRGRGLGSGLLTWSKDLASARGVPLELTVHCQNRARGLYERAGFLPVLETDSKVRMRYLPVLTHGIFARSWLHELV